MDWLQFASQCFSNDVQSVLRFFGITTCINGTLNTHCYAKAYSPILLNVDGNWTFVNDEQWLKSQFPIDITHSYMYDLCTNDEMHNLQFSLMMTIIEHLLIIHSQKHWVSIFSNNEVSLIGWNDTFVSNHDIILLFSWC